MTARRRYGVLILVADFIVAMLLIFSGKLSHIIGPRPPMRVFVIREADPFMRILGIDLGGPPHALRWVVASLLLAVAVVGLLFLVLPREDGT